MYRYTCQLVQSLRAAAQIFAVDLPPKKWCTVPNLEDWGAEDEHSGKAGKGASDRVTLPRSLLVEERRKLCIRDDLCASGLRTVGLSRCFNRIFCMDRASLKDPLSGCERLVALVPTIRARGRRWNGRIPRVHQASFRKAIINAYDGRCALSGIPERPLLEAAHIFSPTDERFHQPVVPNGVPLSKLHHAAFDKHLIGTDPDYRLHVSARQGGRLLARIPEAARRREHSSPSAYPRQPDRERLAIQFEQFKVAA